MSSSLVQLKCSDLLPKHFSLVYCKSEALVPDVLEVLTKFKLLSLPVYDSEQKKWLGFVDLLDLLEVIVFLSEAGELLDGFVSTKKKINWEDILAQQASAVADGPIEEIVDLSGRNPWCAVTEETPLNSLLDMFGSEVGLHRVAIVDSEANILGIISQFRIVQFVYEHRDKFSSDRLEMKVGDWAAARNIVTVPQFTPVIEAYERLLKEKVSAVAIVDEENKFVGVLSATDLKRCFESQCCDAKVLFKGLHLPIKTWFESYGFHLNNHDANCHTVTKETTTAQVVEQIYQHHLHRVFIVDGELHPTGVISLCDLITQLQLA